MAPAGSQVKPTCTFQTKNRVCDCTVYTVAEADACPDCGHLPKLHIGNQHQRIRRRSYEDEFHLEMANGAKGTIPRHDTVTKLHDLMKQYSLVHIRATPASGKTTLLRLLYAFCRSDQSDFNKVYFLAGWPDKPPADYNSWLEDFAQRLEKSLTGADLKSPRFGREKIAILLDEGQHSYHDVHLWHTYIKTDLKLMPNIKFVVASCYGSISDGDDNLNRGPPTPDFIDEGSIVRLYAASPKPGVFFMKTEFDELVMLFVRDDKVLHLHSSLLNTLFAITGGHCGAAYDFLNFIFSSSETKHAMLMDQRLKIFDIHDMDRLHTLIGSMSFRRGLPIQGIADKPEIIHTENVRKVLRHIVTHGKLSILPYDPKKREMHRAIRLCEVKGWITREMSGSAQQQFYAFPTGLHHWWFEYQFFKLASPIQTPLTLQELVLSSISKMTRYILQSFEEVDPATGLKPEANYQNEIFQMISKHTAGAVVAAPEAFVGQGNRRGEKGRLDFLIKLAQGNKEHQLWGIEAVINMGESEMEEHYNRFKPTGEYASARLDDFILLNFQKRPPTRPYYNITNAWTIVFVPDFSSVEIYDARTAILHVKYHISA